MKEQALLRVLIVDDEPYARELLTKLLARINDVEVIGTAENGVAAWDAVQQLEPDLVFLDVQMPGMTGIEVVRKIGIEKMPATIFVTAYDRYATDAFEIAAIDYLLKPYSDARLLSAVQRARRQIQLKESAQAVSRLHRLFSLLDAKGVTDLAKGDYLERIPIESRGQIRVIAIEQIDYITVSGVYAELHVAEKSYPVRERLQSLEERLDPARFLRVHRSAIVQLSRIDVLLRHSGSEYAVRLKSGVQLAVARSKVKDLERWMGVAEIQL